ncbi:MAG: hypothetical protein JWN52_1912 [Actinomycetia bacterium]|nr:hypothetical protein [Actinomycetes bacterium]
MTNAKWTGMMPVDDTAPTVTDTGGAMCFDEEDLDHKTRAVGVESAE